MRLLLITAPLLLASTVTAVASDLTGRASIIDGDTLEIHGTRIRLGAWDPQNVWGACLSFAFRNPLPASVR